MAFACYCLSFGALAMSGHLLIPNDPERFVQDVKPAVFSLYDVDRKEKIFYHSNKQHENILLQPLILAFPWLGL